MSYSSPMTVGELQLALSEYDTNDLVFLESATYLAEMDDGSYETDDLGLHYIVGIYNGKSTPAQRPAPVLQMLRNVTVAADDEGVLHETMEE